MSSRTRERGQALVEFALIVPLLLLLILGVFDVGRVVWTTEELANAAREGARYAIVHGGSRTTPCPVGPPTLEAIIPAVTTACPFPSPSKEGIYAATRSYLVAGLGNPTVTACYGQGCVGNFDAPLATNERGTPVTVTVTADVQLVTGSFLGLGSFPLKASTTLIVSH